MMVAVSQSIPMEGISVGGAGEEVGEEMKGSISDTHLRPHPPTIPPPIPTTPTTKPPRDGAGWIFSIVVRTKTTNNAVFSP